MLTRVGNRISDISVSKYFVETELLVLFLKLSPFKVYQKIVCQNPKSKWKQNLSECGKFV